MKRHIWELFKNDDFFKSYRCKTCKLVVTIPRMVAKSRIAVQVKNTGHTMDCDVEFARRILEE